MRHGVYAGSFDPITNGHLAIIKAAVPLFDRLTVVIASNPEKRGGRFPPDVRTQLAAEALSDVPNVEVRHVPGRLVAQWAAEQGCQFLVRGLRTAADLEQERIIERMNRQIAPSIQTVYIPASPETEMVSSSLVMGLVGNYSWRQAVRKLVPLPVYEHLRDARLLQEFRDAMEPHNRVLEIPQLAGRTKFAWSRIVKAYTAPTRHYHTLDHIADVIEMLDLYVPQTDKLYHRQTAVLAAFYHDVVNGEGPNDEERSAEIVKGDITQQVAPDVARIVKDTYNAGHGAEPTMTGKYFIDADLSVLGRQPEAYAEYTAQVRQEYAQYDDPTYRQGRIAVLESLLAREQIFRTPAFFEAFEFRARQNMRDEILRLKG